MDTTQSRGRLRAFLKHATIHISSTKHHGLFNDSASAHSVEDDSRSQRSSSSTKKDSKLRRIGRGIRQWRSKRRRLHGDTRPDTSHSLEGKSFTSSEASLSEDTSEKEIIANRRTSIDRPEYDHLEATDDLDMEETPEEIYLRKEAHVEPSTRSRPKEDVTSSEVQGETTSEETTIPQTAIVPLPPSNIYSSLLWSDLAPHAKALEPRGIVFRRDRKQAYEFAQSTLNSEPALWTDASHRPVKYNGRISQHHGGIAVAQKIDKQWTVHSAYTSGVPAINQLELLAILMALQRAVQGKQAGTLEKDTIYICSDSSDALLWLEKAFDLATTIRKVAREARALENDVDDIGCLMQLSDALRRWKVLRLSDYNSLGTSLMASIGRRILEQYYELRKLGARAEFHWVPAHSGIPGNEIADNLASLSSWWIAKVAKMAPHSAQKNIGLVMPLKVLKFDEPWTRHCPHQGQPQYSEHEASQVLEDTKNLNIVLSIKAPGSVSCDQTMGPIGARAGTGVMALQPAPQSATRPIYSLPFHLSSKSDEATRKSSALSIKAEFTTDHGVASELCKEVTPMSPPLLSQPKLKGQRQRWKKKKQRAAVNKFPCTYCGERGHMAHHCFDRFPEQKVVDPQRYARCNARKRLEKVTPGAFHNLVWLHPQVMSEPIHGEDSRYMLGRVGICPHLKPMPFALWAVRLQVSQPGQGATAGSIQDDRRHLREKYRWDEAQRDAQLD
ncbi:hypothetical protein Daus18300_004697 [Diaporthe australafricana]|uniref:CCHC-type domain-containing protein n=1 Tax=Diaporthe australafricana TaxID=127596 RepID=A0ABR3X6Y8_9PEZI